MPILWSHKFYVVISLDILWHETKIIVISQNRDYIVKWHLIKLIIRISCDMWSGSKTREKSGNFRHQVNADIHLHTVEIRMRRAISSGFHCFLSYHFIPIIKIWNKQGRCPNLPDVRNYLTSEITWLNPSSWISSFWWDDKNCDPRTGFVYSFLLIIGSL